MEVSTVKKGYKPPLAPPPNPDATSFPPLEELASSVRVSGLAFAASAAPELPARVGALLFDRLELGRLAVAGTEGGRWRRLHYVLPRFGGLKKPAKIQIRCQASELCNV